MTAVREFGGGFVQASALYEQIRILESASA